MMRVRFMLLASLTSFASITSACFGGLDNRPFEPGSGPAELQGSIAGPIDPARAYVAILDPRGLVAPVDASGRFAFTATLAPGMLEIAASTGLGNATRREVTLYAARTLDLSLSPEPGASISGVVRVDVSSTTAPSVRVEDLPVETHAALAGGAFELTSLPPGPIHLVASEPGFESAAVDLDPGSGTSTRAELHLVALGANTCGACVSDRECKRRVCGAFASAHFMITEHACASECGSGGSCPSGFRCTADQSAPARSICVPASTTCAAFASLESSAQCSADAMCGMGISDGICRTNHCTVACFNGQTDCPFGTMCVQDHQDPHGRCQ
jgi:hypothetical protein